MNFSGKQESKPLVLYKLNGDTAPNTVNVTSWISVWLLITQETKFISYCARDIARSQAIISSENKKKEEHEHYLPDSVFCFSLIYFHFIIWGSLFYFSHYYCHKNRILPSVPFGSRPREKPSVFT